MKIILDERLSRLLTSVTLENDLPNELLQVIAENLSSSLGVECRVATDHDHDIGVISGELTFMDEIKANVIIAKTILNSVHHEAIKDRTLARITRRIASKLTDEEKIRFLDAISDGEFSRCASLIEKR